MFSTCITKVCVAAILLLSVGLLQGCGSGSESERRSPVSPNRKNCDCVKSTNNGKAVVVRKFSCAGDDYYCAEEDRKCQCSVPQQGTPSPTPRPTPKGSVTLPPKCLKTQNADCNNAEKNPKCSWKFVKDDLITEGMKKKGYTKGWEVSCFPKLCLGLIGDVCKVHSDSCQWDFVDTNDQATADLVKKTGLQPWQLSCIPKDSCERLQQDACALHPKHCHWEWTGSWETSCKTGPKPASGSTPAPSPAPSPAPTAPNPSTSPCLGLNNDSCKGREDCQWDWVKNEAAAVIGKKGWQVSCLPSKSCEGIAKDVCALHPKKCHVEQDSCKTGPASILELTADGAREGTAVRRSKVPRYRKRSAARSITKELNK